MFSFSYLSTHVAGTICGETYGVANCGTLCAVKVLNKRGSGTSATVIAGIDHAMIDCQSGEKCVANMVRILDVIILSVLFVLYSL